MTKKETWSERRDQAEKLLRESAQAMGLDIIGQAYGRSALAPCEDRDAYQTRFGVRFDTAVVGGNARPLAATSFDHQDIADATPEHLMGMVYQRVASAKAEIVRQLKDTLARLESMPG